MFIITKIREQNSHILEYLLKRNLLEQYKKAKAKIQEGNLQELKYRAPKAKGILYFRINKQYRAYGRMLGDMLVIFEINNHQNGLGKKYTKIEL